MKVYLDIVWMMNLLIDGLLILLTSLVLKRQIKKRRLFLSALFASFIVILLFTPLGTIAYNPFGKLVYSALIVLIAFGYRRLSLFLQALGMFYLVTFVMGGGLFALHFFLQSQSFYVQGMSLSTYGFGDPISWMLIFVGFPLLWWFSKKRFDQVVLRKWKADERMNVRIQFGDLVIEGVGIVDTGNQLRHPLNQAPVMFISHEICRNQLPELLFSPDPLKALGDPSLPEEWAKRLTVIPYRNVSGGNLTVLGLKPDVVELRSSSGELFCKKVIVALTDHQLSIEEDFNCILHPDMVQLGQAA